MLLVQEFLEHKTFGDLVKEHGVYASFSKSGHKWSLNYDQIEAKETDPLACQCRGLVLSCEDGHSLASQAVMVNSKLCYDHICPGKTRVLAYPMNRFFNMGQGCAAIIDWSDPMLAILEKLDGTLCIVYWDPFRDPRGVEGWCVATRSVSEADLLMDNGLFTFRSLFEKAMEDTCKFSFNDLTSYLDKAYTYCFELTTPYNRIVVSYPNNGITLLAARNMKTLQEEDPACLGLATVIGVPFVQAHTYTTMNELVDWVSSLNPAEHEGVVVRDGCFNRIKVKNANYVALNKIRDALGTSPRNCLEIILNGKEDDVISFLPQEVANNLLSIKERYRKWLEKQEQLYTQILLEASVINTDKKTFAITLNKYGEPFKPAFFAIFMGKATSVKNFIDVNRKDGTWSNGFLDTLLDYIEN
jgi:cytochrome b involved in lipid metabolism